MPDGLRLLVDQNISRTVSTWLARTRPSWQIEHVYDLGLSRATDTDLAARAHSTGAVILTFDEDFADHRASFASLPLGVIRLRVWPTTDEEVVAALTRLLAEVDEDRLHGSLTVVGRSSIRLRPWPPDSMPREAASSESDP